MGVKGIGETAVKVSTARKGTAARKAEGTAGRTVSISKPNNKKKKRLNYNYRELSNQLMRTRTSMGASQVLVRAFQRVGILQRQYRSGDYNENEARRALIHAESIARVARKRVKHLKEEERLKKGGPCDAELEEEEEFRPEDIDLQKQELPEMSSEEMERLMEELEEAMRDLEKESMETMEELTVTVQEDMDPEDLKLLKKKHRSKELREIMEADLKYLKALFQELEKERREGSSGSSGVSSSNSNSDLSGVTLELAGMEMSTQTTAAAAVPTQGVSIDVSV